MSYQVRVGKRIRKAMRRFPLQDQARIMAVLRALADKPRPAGCLPVKRVERGTYRLRVGNYRIIYVILDDEQVIMVARVSRRSEGTYKKLQPPNTAI